MQGRFFGNSLAECGIGPRPSGMASIPLAASASPECERESERGPSASPSAGRIEGMEAVKGDCRVPDAFAGASSFGLQFRAPRNFRAARSTGSCDSKFRNSPMEALLIRRCVARRGFDILKADCDESMGARTK